jgi:hypothetical protein
MFQIKFNRKLALNGIGGCLGGLILMMSLHGTCGVLNYYLDKLITGGKKTIKTHILDEICDSYIKNPKEYTSNVLIFGSVGTFMGILRYYRKK